MVPRDGIEPPLLSRLVYSQSPGPPGTRGGKDNCDSCEDSLTLLPVGQLSFGASSRTRTQLASLRRVLGLLTTRRRWRYPRAVRGQSHLIGQSSPGPTRLGIPTTAGLRHNPEDSNLDLTVLETAILPLDQGCRGRPLGIAVIGPPRGPSIEVVRIPRRDLGCYTCIRDRARVTASRSCDVFHPMPPGLGTGSTQPKPAVGDVTTGRGSPGRWRWGESNPRHWASCGTFLSDRRTPSRATSSPGAGLTDPSDGASCQPGLEGGWGG